MFSKLQYISQGVTAQEQLDNIQEALRAGCDWIQVRFKNQTGEEVKALAVEAKKRCTLFSATLIINDHPVIAKETEADGVHIGLQDMPVAIAREYVGNKIIGGTANTLADVLQRVKEGCNYIGLGPFRFTNTKKNLSPILGLRGYKKIMEELAQLKIKLPIYAIGGIRLEDIGAILQTGVYGVAVSGTVTYHHDKKLLLKQINGVLACNN